MQQDMICSGEDPSIQDLHRKVAQAAFFCLLQLLSERLMGAEGTKLEEDFLKMERVEKCLKMF